MSAVPTVYSHYLSDDACRFHRLLLPARHAGGRRADLRWVCGGDANPAGADAYVMHGMPTRLTLQVVGGWKRAGAAFVYSCDDDYTALPDWNPVKASAIDLDNLAAVHSLADLILCSTEALGDTFRRRGLGHKVCVAPNLADLQCYPAEPPPEPAPGGPVRFLWAGSITHQQDLAVMAEGVAAALAALPRGAVEVTFLGAAPPHPLLTDWLHRGVVWQQPVAFMDYWKYLGIFSPHVVLSPMADCEFNKSKSALRPIEAGALHAAVIATPFGEYADAVDEGETGFFASDPDDWRDAVAALVADHDRRRGMGLAGRRRIEERYSWQNQTCHAPWNAFLDRLAAIIGRR